MFGKKASQQKPVKKAWDIDPNRVAFAVNRTADISHRIDRRSNEKRIEYRAPVYATTNAMRRVNGL